MGLTNFDELNTLSTTETTKDDRHKATRKKIPIHDYFENMQISEEEKEKRVRLANLLLADVLFLFALSRRNRDTRYLSSVKKVTEPDQKMQRYIRKVCDSIVKTTLKSGLDDGKKQGEALTDSDAIKVSQDSYAVSIERATSVAENEANAILNGEEYSNAVKNGCTKKRWKSYRDESPGRSCGCRWTGCRYQPPVSCGKIYDDVSEGRFFGSGFGRDCELPVFGGVFDRCR